MNIVIVGDGKVGYTLAEQLNAENHDITVIDNNAQALGHLVNTLDVMGVRGNGASRDVLIEAGVPDADLLIAATSGDEVNMLSCLMARSLGVKRTVARVRNPEYLSQHHLLREELGLSLVINPELEAAREVARVIKFPSALKVDTFCRGRVEMIEYRLPKDSEIVGKRLMDLSFKSDEKVLICAVERDGAVTIPNGSFVIRGEDKLFITGDNRGIPAFLRYLGTINFKVRTLMIVGGGKIGFYLGKILLENRVFQVKIVERDLERCESLCERLPRATIIHGDGSDAELLESEGLDGVDAFVALTDRDEENLIMSMVAKGKKVPKIVTKISKSNYMSIAEQMNIGSVVSPKHITADQITRYVRTMQDGLGSNITTLYKIADGRTEALEFTATGSTKNLGVTLEKLRLRQNILLAVIVRGGMVIIPKGKDYVQEGDSVVVLSLETLDDLNDIFL